MANQKEEPRAARKTCRARNGLVFSLLFASFFTSQAASSSLAPLEPFELTSTEHNSLVAGNDKKKKKKNKKSRPQQSGQGARSGQRDSRSGANQASPQRNRQQAPSQARPVKKPSSSELGSPLPSKNKSNSPKKNSTVPSGSTKKSAPGVKKESRPSSQGKTNKEKNRQPSLANPPKGNPRNSSSERKETNKTNPASRKNVNTKNVNQKNVNTRNVNKKKVSKNYRVVKNTKRVDKTVIKRGGWGYRRSWVTARPWGWGWYSGWAPSAYVYPGWSWWNAASPRWGAVSLSPTIVIQQSVNTAVRSRRDWVSVPNSDFSIYHSSIEPIGDRVIEFTFELEDEAYLAKADCELGLLNDEEPASLDEAELMHSACTIAFNSFDDA